MKHLVHALLLAAFLFLSGCSLGMNGGTNVGNPGPGINIPDPGSHIEPDPDPSLDLAPKRAYVLWSTDGGGGAAIWQMDPVSLARLSETRISIPDGYTAYSYYRFADATGRLLLVDRSDSQLFGASSKVWRLNPQSQYSSETNPYPRQPGWLPKSYFRDSSGASYVMAWNSETLGVRVWKLGYQDNWVSANPPRYISNSSGVAPTAMTSVGDVFRTLFSRPNVAANTNFITRWDAETIISAAGPQPSDTDGLGNYVAQSFHQQSATEGRLLLSARNAQAASCGLILTMIKEAQGNWMPKPNASLPLDNTPGGPKNCGWRPMQYAEF